MTNFAPGKWNPRWTGPHTIAAVQDGRYSNRYTERHATRKREIENVLSPYTSWSSSIASTPADLDASTKVFVVGVGAWCKEGDLFIVPLARPYPFGAVGKVLEASDDGRIRHQWKGYGATNAYEPMWWDGRRSYRGRRRSKDHVPFEDKDTGIVIRQEDLVLHGFTMTKTSRLRETVLDECARNADVWWQRRGDGPAE